MHYVIGDSFWLRMLEPSDVGDLYSEKNDPEVGQSLGGFSTGYSRKDIEEWLDFHRSKSNEVLWAVAEKSTNRCVGHVGLYEIDHRVRSAEFAIMLGDRSTWGKGIGRLCTVHAIRYGFLQLNLNRIHLSVLVTNERARTLYESLGFVEEGRLRQAQYKNGDYIDVVLMSLLRQGWDEADGG